ncbi:MAG: AAA family ATPase [Acidobacteriia bacterium]|nr:AAA family ATPase [Terriglobia bacterium]
MPDDLPKPTSAPTSATAIQEAPPPGDLDPTRHGEATHDFEAFLRARIVGQDAAIEAVTEIYQMFTVSMAPPDRPIGNLLFLGPTGSGKTYLVEVVAEALFGNRHAFIKVDCAEFQEHHEIAKLIGSPPGYVGHLQTPPLLNQESINRWQTENVKLTLVLFDEIEKASEALWQLLLGILDKGTLTLGDNSHVDLSRCLIFLTSNLGASQMSDLVLGGMGFAPHDAIADENLDAKIERTATEAARKKFSPEFLNRLDKVVVFRTLRPEQLDQILELELAKVQTRILEAIGQSHFTFRCLPEVKKWLLKEGTDPKYGARHLKRVIERRIVYSLANLVATRQIATGDCIDISLRADGTLAFTKATIVAGIGGAP